MWEPLKEIAGLTTSEKAEWCFSVTYDSLFPALNNQVQIFILPSPI